MTASGRFKNGRRAAALALGVAGAAAAAGGAAPPAFRPAAPGFAWRFPRDHRAHPAYRSEWWYFTGHLETAGPTPRRFGYQLTFFRVGMRPDRPAGDSAWRTRGLVMGHMALTDVGAQRHRFSEVLRRESPLLGGFGAAPGEPLAWVLAPAGTTGRWSLGLIDEGRPGDHGFAFSAADRAQGYALELTTRPIKPRIFQGPGGLSKKSATEDTASLYYSYTRLATAGTLRLGDEALAVTGVSWMDKEFGSSKLAGDQVGWDWFSLQLADGRDLMVYLLRRADGSLSFGRGTLVDAGGAVTYLAPDAWDLAATGRWTSPETGATYPHGWRLTLPGHGVDLAVTPAMAGQENRPALVANLAYWEGAVDLTDAAGRPAGRGFVELTGYVGGPGGGGVRALR